jgi:hypothetical protein
LASAGGSGGRQSKGTHYCLRRSRQLGYRRIEDTSGAGDALREAIAELGGGCRLIELQAELAAPPQSI